MYYIIILYYLIYVLIFDDFKLKLNVQLLKYTIKIAYKKNNAPDFFTTAK